MQFDTEKTQSDQQPQNCRVPKNLTFKNEAKSKIFLVKMCYICMRIKIVFISMALHFASL